VALLYRSGPARDWLEDLNVRVERDTIELLIDPSEELYLYRWTRRLRPHWLLVWGSLGGVPGGLLGSQMLWRTPEWGLVAGLFLVLLALTLRWFSAVAFGRTMADRTGGVVLCGAAIGLAVQLGGPMSSPALAYLLGMTAAALVGLFYATRCTPWIRGNSAWVPGAMLAGGAAAVWGTYILRYGGGEESIVTAWLAGGCAATAFFCLLLGLFAHHFNAAGGLRDLARIYAHNEATIPLALKHLGEAIRLSPRDAELHSHRGALRSVAGDFEGSEEDYRRVHQLLPRRAEPIMNRGLDLARQGLLDDALKLLGEARQLSPAHPLVHCNLGVVHGQRGDHQAAVEAYGKAIALKSDYARAYSNRAYAYLSLGRYEEALHDSDQALRHNKRSAMAHVHRGQALAGLGRREEATEAFRSAIRTGGEIGAADEARKGLEELG
jgi:Flp pilus assembly protein TadD